MTTEHVGLEIEIVNTKAKKAVGPDLEAAMRKSARGMERDAARVEKKLADVGKSAEKTRQSMFDAGSAGGKAAGIAGAAFSSLSAGLSAAQSNAENFEASMLSAGASVAAAFATGGPAGAGLAIASIGLGFLIKEAKEAGSEYERLGEKAKAAGKASEGAAERARAATAGLRREVTLLTREYQLRATGRDFDADAESRKLRVIDLEREHAAQVREANKHLQESLRLRQVADSIDGSLDVSRGGLLNFSDHNAKAKAEDAMRAEIAAAKAAEEAARQIDRQITSLRSVQDELARIVDLDRLHAENQRIIADNAAERARAARELDEIDARHLALEEQLAGVMTSLTPEYQKRREEMGAYVDLYDRLLANGYDNQAADLRDQVEAMRERNEAAQEAARAAEREAAAAKEKQRAEEAARRRAEDLNRTLDERLQLERASNRFEEERIRLEHEKRRLLEQGADAKKVELLHQEKLAKLAKDEAEQKQKAAEAEAKKTTSAKQAAQATRRAMRGDVTQSFHRVGGNGFGFGFGRGRVGQGLGNIFLPVTSQKPKLGQGAKVADPSPEVKAAAEQGKKQADALEKTKAEASKLLGVSKQAANVAVQVASGVGGVAVAMDGVVTELARVRGLLQQLERATLAAGRAAAGGP